jgi:hypothetical protein
MRIPIQNRHKANTLKRHRYTRKAIKRPMFMASGNKRHTLCTRLYLRFSSTSPCARFN